MKFFDVLNLNSAAPITSERCKIHLASWDGGKDPLDVFLEGSFDEWQSWQTKKNFGREYIVSLINLPQKDRWLFAGIYRSNGFDVVEGVPYGPYRYNTTILQEYADLVGRMAIAFKRPGRNSYLDADNWTYALLVSEIWERKITIARFPGFHRTKIMKSTLDIIMKEGLDSWKSPLSSVGGVYLITDKATGKQYVGSAYGLGGIWGRWSIYSNSGHGGNADLRRLLEEKGGDYAKNFQFSILEIADTHANEKDIIEREGHWKEVLFSREFGYNKN